jgi:hypothetical protein
MNDFVIKLGQAAVEDYLEKVGVSGTYLKRLTKSGLRDADKIRKYQFEDKLSRLSHEALDKALDSLVPYKTGITKARGEAAFARSERIKPLRKMLNTSLKKK